MNEQENERTLIALEMGLRDPVVRRSASQLNDLIATDFVEFGASGETFSKDDIISSMLAEEENEIVAREFIVRWLAHNIALVTYRTSDGSADTNDALCSSLWKYYAAKWQMIFHQSTVII